MVQHQRYYHNHNMKKGEHTMKGGDEESQTQIPSSSYYYKKRLRPKLMIFIFLSIFSCCLIWAPHMLGFSSTLSLLYSQGEENEQMPSHVSSHLPLCSSMSNGTICCDRTSIRTDVCYMKGDVRTHTTLSSIFLYAHNDPRGVHDSAGNHGIDKAQEFQHEKIRPYTRKWETSVMNSIDELSLVSKHKSAILNHKCDVVHHVPAVFFSTGGYTGNVYHEFNDGIIPLYITSQHLNKKVVFVILEYHNWWYTKYGDILSHLTDYPLIDFRGDLRTHCFPEAVVGLNIHDELSIDQSLMKDDKSIRDFRDVLDRAYLPRITDLIQDEERENQMLVQQQPSASPLSTASLEDLSKKPKLVIMSRNGSRAITNEDLLVKLAEEIGFRVEIVKPGRTSELAKIYRALNTSDVMIGVHGAAMTHFLFVKPGRVFIQVVPLGTDWAAETYYGEPAVKLGLKYIGYRILPRESSLYKNYDRDDLVLRDPNAVNQKGWEYTKRIYLDNQNVTLDLKRFKKRLVRSYAYLVSRRTHGSRPQTQ